MSCIFLKSELERLADSFARQKVMDAAVMPENMPDVVNTREWAEATAYQRKLAVQAILDVARQKLIKSGYRREMVFRNIPKQ